MSVTQGIKLKAMCCCSADLKTGMTILGVGGGVGGEGYIVVAKKARTFTKIVTLGLNTALDNV